MRSFAPAFIAAALATFISAAPVNLPAERSVGAPSIPGANLGSLPLPGSSTGQLSSVEGAVESATGAIGARSKVSVGTLDSDASGFAGMLGARSKVSVGTLDSDASGFAGMLGARSKVSVGTLDGDASGFVGMLGARSKLTDTVKSLEGEISGVHARENTPSVAAIFASILTEIQPHTEELTYITASNCTLAEITDVVASIKAPILAAIPELQVLVGAEASVILAPVGAATVDVELTVSEVATIVGADVDLVLAAAGTVLSVAEAEASEIVADVEVVLADLGSTVTSLVEAAVVLVDGLAASLSTVVAPVDGVIVELKLTALASLLGVSV